MTTVLLWPESHELSMRLKVAGLNSALVSFKEAIAKYKAGLESGTNQENHDELTKFAWAMISVYVRPTHKSKLAECVNALLEAALALDALDILQKAISYSQYIKRTMRAQDWASAIKQFGFTSLRESCVYPLF